MSEEQIPLDEEAFLALAGIVENHEDRLVALESGGSGAEAAEDDAELLDAYVKGLVSDFSMAEVPKDWRAFPAIVHELEALRRAHAFAYSKEAGAFDRIYYLDAVARVRQRCSEHKSNQGRALAVGRPAAS